MPVESKRIYDLGMHKGEDTAFYLALGYDVIAFEANPDLVAAAKERFADKLRAGSLTIVQGAIAEAGSDPIVFYRNKWKSVWGTTSADWAARNARMLRGSESIEVERVDFAEVVSTYGVPFYLKMDIEGAEDIVLNVIERQAERPAFISLESEKIDFAAVVEQADRLRRLGYTRFKAVQQASLPGRAMPSSTADGGTTTYTFEPHASGPFGDDSEGPWQSFAEVLATYHRIFASYERIGDGTLIGRYGRPATKAIEKMFDLSLPGWHDLHAAL